MDKKDKCAHPSCVCTKAKDSDYCGAFCAGAEKTADITCGCGHAGCSDAATTRRSTA